MAAVVDKRRLGAASRRKVPLDQIGCGVISRHILHA
jgi:hypothetical protein